MADYSKTPIAERQNYFETVSLCYIYKKYSGIQLKLIRSFTNAQNPYETKGWSAMIESAKMLDTESASSRNPRLDWRNSISMKLSDFELAKLARYTNLDYVKLIGTGVPTLDENGSIVKDAAGRINYRVSKSGTILTFGENFYHNSPDGVASTFVLGKSKKDYLGASIYIKKGDSSISIALSNDELWLFAHCCEQALDWINKFKIDEQENYYNIWKSAKLDAKNGRGSNRGYSASATTGGMSNSGYSVPTTAPTSYRDSSPMDSFAAGPIEDPTSGSDPLALGDDDIPF